mmetsp:Transcript_21228/g.49194  ORF Transcript_21228/g.49194 Transcript_21228/m.49194 type:complete len:314 (+) Transcript_21228:441-1382(+)
MPVGWPQQRKEELPQLLDLGLPAPLVRGCVASHLDRRMEKPGTPAASIPLEMRQAMPGKQLPAPCQPAAAGRLDEHAPLALTPVSKTFHHPYCRIPSTQRPDLVARQGADPSSPGASSCHPASALPALASNPAHSRCASHVVWALVLAHRREAPLEQLLQAPSASLWSAVALEVVHPPLLVFVGVLSLFSPSSEAETSQRRTPPLLFCAFCLDLLLLLLSCFCLLCFASFLPCGTRRRATRYLHRAQGLTPHRSYRGPARCRHHPPERPPLHALHHLAWLLQQAPLHRAFSPVCLVQASSLAARCFAIFQGLS